MAVTKGKIISDIELRLTKGKPSDDVSIYRTQIAHWLDIERDNLLVSILNNSIEDGDDVDPFYVVSDLCLSPVMIVDNCVDCDNKRRFYITLTRDVLKLNDDRGIIRITDNKGKNIPVLDQNEMDDLRLIPYAAPTKNRQAAYREGARNIFIEKLDRYGLEYFEYDVYYVPRAVGASLTDDDDYPMADEDIPELIDRVVEIGLKQMNQGVGDLENDGTDPQHYAGE